MKTVLNAALAARRRRQATLLSVVGIAVLLLGLYFNFQPGPQRVLYAYFALLIGSVLSWVGVSMADQWVRPPRANDALAEVMKGASAAYALYHWVLPAEHVLLTPAGLILIRVFNIEGAVTVRGAKWRDARPFLRKLFSLGRQPVRNPERLLAEQAAALKSALVARDASLADVPMQPLGLFTNRRVELTVEEPQPLALRADALRDWLRADGKGVSLPPATRRALEAALDDLAAERLGTDKQAEARAKSEAAAKSRAAEQAAKDAAKKEAETAERRERARAKRTSGR